MEVKHTYDLGLIGNCSYQAHIHTNTNVEWMCWPRFDSSFIFGGLLDQEKGDNLRSLPVVRLQTASRPILKIPIFFVLI